ncbi:hypothetical protein FKM82_028388 [Ascaphus truei]
MSLCSRSLLSLVLFSFSLLSRYLFLLHFSLVLSPCSLLLSFSSLSLSSPSLSFSPLLSRCPLLLFSFSSPSPCSLLPPSPCLPRTPYPQPRTLSPPQRCEETERVKAQVAQERELRAVAEGCLIEQETAWRAIHCQLETTCSLAEDAQRASTQLRSCQEELSHRLGKVAVQKGRAPGCRAAGKGSRCVRDGEEMGGSPPGDSRDTLY